MQKTLSIAAAAIGLAGPVQAGDGDFGSDRRFLQQDGAAIYRAICQGCHMPDAKGAVGAGRYPALAGNPKLEASGYPLFIVLNGQKGMPGFAAWLDDAQVAAVVNFVRTHFGNDYQDSVSPDDVKALR